MKDQLLTPEEALNTPIDESRGSTLSFGQRCWMPGIDINGSDYSIAYENMTEEHLKGIPVRVNGRLIGHCNTDTKGNGTVTLLEGETLPHLKTDSKFNMGLVGLAPTCETIALESLIKTFEACVNET